MAYLLCKNNIEKLLLVVVIFFFSCDSFFFDVNEVLDGTYYRTYEEDGEIAYSFISIKGDKFIKDYTLYKDIKKLNVIKRNTNIEYLDFFDYEIDKKIITVIDHTGSYEIVKNYYPFKKVIISNPRYKIVKRGEDILLKDIESKIVYKKNDFNN